MTTPATINGLRKYLGSGLIKGIGPVMADRIVDHFQLTALEVLDGHPERLSEVDGIGPKRAAQIIQAWREQRGVKEVMIFLQGHGVGAAFSARIFRQYGDRAVEVVRSNPYRLAREIQGIGFPHGRPDRPEPGRRSGIAFPGPGGPAPMSSTKRPRKGMSACPTTSLCAGRRRS